MLSGALKMPGIVKHFKGKLVIPTARFLVVSGSYSTFLAFGISVAFVSITDATVSAIISSDVLLDKL